MAIPINSICIQCHFNGRMELARKLGNEEQAMELARRTMEAILENPKDLDSAWLGGISDKLVQEIYGTDPDQLKAEKASSNRFVMERLDSIESRVEKASDPVLAALQFAILGNYLDFAALKGEVDFSKMDSLLDSAQDIELDKDCYEKFAADLKKGKKLLYLTDNAGEIVFDRVLAETIKKHYPQIEITVCVRGGPVSNDATGQDAEDVGITFPVIDSGNSVGGTVLHLAGPALKAAFQEADVIIAKGMGNTESLFGCGYNVYYGFLVKCPRFEEFFRKPKLTPMFIHDTY